MMETLDLRGLKCPLPALLVFRVFVCVGVGVVFVFVTDDPMAPIDVPHMCRHEGFEFVSVTRDGNQARMVLRRPTLAAVARDRGD